MISFSIESVLRKRFAFYYGWVNVVIASVAMTATLPGRTHGLGLITKPLIDELGLSEVAFGTLNLWAILLGAAFAWPTGALVDRFGGRLVLTVVALALGAAVLWMSRVTGKLDLFITLTLTRGFGQGALTVVSMALVGKWFLRRIGLAMGVFTLLVGLGFIAVTLGVGQAVQVYDWRTAWAGVGRILIFGLAPVSWLLVRNRPEKSGLTAEKEFLADTAARTNVVDLSLRAALTTQVFWAVTLATSLYGLIWSAITLFNQLMLEDHGFDAKDFYWAMAVLAGSGMICNLLGGWLTTRESMARLLAIGMLLLAAALLAYPQITTLVGVIIYAIVLGGAGGIIAVVYLAIYVHAFGHSHVGQIQGFAQILSIGASAVGPVLFAACKQWSGSYHPMFYVAAPAVVALGLWAWLVPLPSSRQTLDRSGDGSKS